jgi:hypothetical protein
MTFSFKKSFSTTDAFATDTFNSTVKSATLSCVQDVHALNARLLVNASIQLR